MKYLKELDGLRAIAILLVIICHWTIPGKIFNQDRLDTFGELGVNIFFVLSGYLISYILLHNRIESEASSISKVSVLKNFYIRRALRILPAFYLLLLSLYVASFAVPEIKLRRLFYGVAYVINLYFYKHQTWGEFTIHLWSLAVEEQYYLTWPLVLLFIKRKYLFQCISLSIVIAIIAQSLSKTYFGYILTYACFDAFGFGALLAAITLIKPGAFKSFYYFISGAAVLCLIILLVEFLGNHWYPLPERTMHSICALWVICFIKNNQGRPAGFALKLLGSRILVFIGKISYGMYLYHLYIPWIRNAAATRIFGNRDWHPGEAVLFIFDLLVTIGVAFLSWKLIEQPILGFKKYFTTQQIHSKPILP